MRIRVPKRLLPLFKGEHLEWALTSRSAPISHNGKPLGSHIVGWIYLVVRCVGNQVLGRSPIQTLFWCYLQLWHHPWVLDEETTPKLPLVGVASSLSWSKPVCKLGMDITRITQRLLPPFKGEHLERAWTSQPALIALRFSHGGYLDTPL